MVQLDAALQAVRTATAGLAVAVALLLLFRIPLVATFRAAIVVLAMLELLSFGYQMLSRRGRVADWLALALKLAVLTTAYLVLSS